jgi:CelD/BcsL family acetyltransferase involved in cellulose biosynthesis
MLLENGRALSPEILTNESSLEALRPEWSKLWAHCPDATPFQSPEWLLPWWSVFGNGRMRTLTLRAGTTLVALLPAYVLGDALQFLGIGTSDHLDALIEPGWEMEAATAMLGFVANKDTEWERVEFQQLPPGSPLVEAAAPPGWSDEISVQDVCPVLSLPRRVDELHEFLPRRQLENLRYYRRRAERLGAVSFEVAQAGNFDELFKALVTLHNERWTARGSDGVFADEKVLAFHGDVLARMVAAGMLRLFALRVAGVLAGVLYGFSDARTFCYYLGGFDARFAEVSPGTLLIGHAIEEAIREGADRFDFLRGQERYKSLWGAKVRPNWNRSLRRASHTRNQ